VPRYLVHFADGGAGMRDYPEPLTVGDLIRDGVNGTYRIARVEPPAAERGLHVGLLDPG
jgi:hypothetical protein